MKNMLGQKMNNFVLKLEQYADRSWYGPLICLLSALDQFLIIIPNDGILVASSMIMPKRWPIFAISTSVGSTLGITAIFLLVKSHGLPWVIEFYPGLDQTEMWKLTENFFGDYGLLMVFAIGASPLVQQPIIILAALANIPLVQVISLYLLGRFAKYFFLGYVASHSPKYLKKLWGIRNEMKDAGIKLD